MDFISDDGGTRLGFDDADDVIANEEFSSWLNTQLPGTAQGPLPQPQPSPPARMSATNINSQLPPGPSPLPSAGMTMGQPRKMSPAAQISPKTQSGTPNPYNAWKNSANPAAASTQRQSPLNGTPGFDGPMHGRTPSVAAEMSRYMAQMPSQRMMQQPPQAGSPGSLGMPPGMQTPQMPHAPPQGPQGPPNAATGPAGMDGMPIPPREILSRQSGGPQMNMPPGMPQMEGPMSQMGAMPQALQGRASGPRMHPQAMSPATQHRPGMMGAGMSQGVSVPPGTPGGPQASKGAPQGMSHGPQGIAGPMGGLPHNQPQQMYASPNMPGQMMNGGMQDGPMPFPPSMQSHGSPTMTESVMSPQMGSHMPPSMYSPQSRMANAQGAASAAAAAATRRVKRRTASITSNGGGPGISQSPVAPSPRPTPTPSATFSPTVIGPQGPLSRPMSRPGSRVGSQQSPQQPMAQNQFPGVQIPMQHTVQPGAMGPAIPPGPVPTPLSQGVNRGAGPAQSPMQSHTGATMGPQGPSPHPGGPARSVPGGGLHVYSMPDDVVRLALISLSLYTQVHKFGPQSIAMREIVRRIDSFPAIEQRRMVEKFEISRGGSSSELAKLPIARVLPPIFWRTLAECYSQMGLPPVPQTVSLGANGPQIPLFPLFQAVQTVGGYIDTTLTGRWPVVLRMLDMPSQGSLSPIEIIWVYATTILPFEVYAAQHEAARRQLVSQLGPPRTSGPQVGVLAAGPGTGPRPGTPGSAGPIGSDMPGGMGSTADMRHAPLSSTAQRMLKGPPTQQAPAMSQAQLRAPQRRPAPGLAQQGINPATQAIPRDAMVGGPRAPSQMGMRGDQVGVPNVGISSGVPGGAGGPQPGPGEAPARAGSAMGMQKPVINGSMPGIARGPYTNPSVAGPRRAPSASSPMFGPMPGVLGQQNGPDMASVTNRQTPVDIHSTIQQGASVANMQQRLMSEGVHPSARPPIPGISGTAEVGVGSKRPSLVDEDGRKRSRLGGPRHAEQMRRETQGKNTFSILSENGQYLLQRRHSSTHGGRNIRFLSALGNEIENWRPEVAFPLDLGIVDLHAVTRSLASHQPAEVRQTLDKLIVVSANPRVHESLQHCPRLLANLCKLVMNMIDQLLLPTSNKNIVHPSIGSTEIEIVEDDVKLFARGSKGLEAMNNAFKKYKRESPGEIVIEVDSQTGAEVGTRSTRGVGFERNGSTLDALNSSAEATPVEVQQPSVASSSSDDAASPSSAEPESDSDKNKPFYYPSYATRYQRVESELSTLEKPPDEMSGFLMTSLCDRLLLATCVLRNLSFSETNRPVIARKPEFLQLLWRLLEVLGTHEKILDSNLRTLDLCKDLLTVLGNVALYIQLPNSRETLKLMLFLLSFAPVESPFTEKGELKLMDYDIDVHRYLPNAIDVFAKIAPRENPNRRLVEEVLLGTCEDPDYKDIIGRWLKVQGRDKLYPAELLSRMFALSIAMMPFTHFRPPSRDIDTRQPYLLQATMAAELLVNSIPDDEDDNGVNIALSWLESVEHFGARMVRTLNFMGMVVVNQPEVNGEYMRPFAKITQRGVNVVQRLFKKAKRSSDFNGSGIVPTIEHLLGGLMAANMDKVVVKHLNALYDESTKLQESDESLAKSSAYTVRN